MANDVVLKLRLEGDNVVVNGVNHVSKSIDGMGGSAKRAIADVAHLGGAFAVFQGLSGSLSGAARAIDEFTTAASRIGLVSVSASAAATAQGALFKIAQESRVEYAALAETYARLAKAGNELGVSQSRMLGVTKSISQAMTIGGGSAESMKAALMQLSQGFASGTLRGEELNSIMEQTPRLAQAIADGMGKSVGELRKLGEEGKLTAQAVMGALEKQAPAIAAEFAKMTPTISQAFTVLKDGAAKAFYEFDKGSGISAELAVAMTSMAKSLGDAGSAAREFGESYGSAIKTVGEIAGILAAIAAVNKLSGALAGLARFAANPITIAVSLVVGGVKGLDALLHETESGLAFQLAAAEKRVAAGIAARDSHGYGYKDLPADSRGAMEADLKSDERAVESLRAALRNLRIEAAANDPTAKAAASMRQSDRDWEAEQKAADDALANGHKKAFGAYMESVKSEKAKQIDAENDRWKALTAVIGTSGKEYETALAAHNAKLAEINKKGAGGSTNSAAEKARREYLKSLENDADAEALIIKEQLKFYEQRDKAMQGYLSDEQKRSKQLAETSERMNDELATLGMTTEELARYRAEKLDTAAASALLAANQLEEAAVHLETQKVLPDIAQKYRELAAAKREAAGEMSEQALTGVNIAAKRVAIDAAKDSAKAWEKFSDDIERSLTDALMRSFESGESFGDSFINNLKNTFKTAALKLVIQTATSGAGNLVGSLGNSAINSVLGTSGSNGGAGTNYLGIANNASTLSNIYGAGSQLLTGASVGASGASLAYANGVGALGGDSLGALISANGQWAGVAVEMAASAEVATLAAAAATEAAAAAGAGTIGTAAGVAPVVGEMAAGAGAGTAAASGGSGAAGSMSALWPLAIIAGMFMSGEAWQSGIRWENYAKDPDAKKYDAEVGIRASKDEPMRAIFGDEFVESKFYAVMSGSSLSAQIHGAIQKGLWGGDWEMSGKSQLRGTFSENDQGFSGQEGQSFKKDGGWFHSDKKKTEWDPASADLDAVLDQTYRVIRNSLVMAGETFKDYGMAEKLKGFSFSTTHKNTSDMGASINLMSDQLAQAMGEILFPSINELRVNTVEQAKALKVDLEQAKRAGNLALASNLEAQIKNLESLSTESWIGAFGRIMQEAQSVNRILDLMGTSILETFGENNANRVLLLSASLVEMFGGVDKLNTSFGAYYANFYSQEEQRAQALKDMGKAFGNLNVTMPTSREGFRDIVDGLDLATVGGQATFKAMMDLQDGFAKLVPAIEETAAATTKAAEDAAKAKAIANERGGLQGQLNELTMTNAQLLNLQRDALDESNRGLFDQVNAINTATNAMADLAAQIDAIGSTRASVGSTKQGIVSQMAGFNAPAFYAAQAATLKAQFSSATTTDSKLNYAGLLTQSISDGLNAQIEALNKTRDVRISALQEEATLAESNASVQREAASAMAGALKNISDYARGMKTGNLSVLSPEAKLSAARAEYNRTLSETKSGDVNAAGRLSGTSDNYLGLAKDYYASSSAYSNIFNSVESQLTSVGSQASVYENIANNTKSTFDLATATAAIDSTYQSNLLALQQSAVSELTKLDTSLMTYQKGVEAKLDEQVLELNSLGVSNVVIADKVEASQAAITASVDRVNAAQEKMTALLAQMTALMAEANRINTQTAVATTSTASNAALAGAA